MNLEPPTLRERVSYYWFQLRMKTSSKYRAKHYEFEALLVDMFKKGILK